MMFKKVLLALFIAAAICFGGAAGAEAAPVLTLERAKAMALEQGVQIETVRLSYAQAELSLAQLRSRFELSPYFTAERLKKEADQLQALMDERLKAIGLLEESIKAWEKELAALAVGSAAAGGLQRKIGQAQSEIDRYNRQLDELRPAFTATALRYHEQKAREEDAESQLRPAESALTAAEDALGTQPRVIAYAVEQIYLSLLAMAKQREQQALVVQNLERLLRMEQRLLDLGRSSTLRVDQAEERLRQGQQGAASLRQQQDSLQRSFRRQLGLPDDFAFALAEVIFSAVPDQAVLEQEMPDLTAAISHRRKVAELAQKRKDLADTPESERYRYRAAELAVAQAELNLRNSLSSLTQNYQTRAEALELAVESLRNSEFSRQNSSRALSKARLQFRLGLISQLEMEQQQISSREAEVKLFSARQHYHLALLAYGMARDGIIAE